MILGQQQRTALERISRFLKSERHFFLLKGYAGTGKTSIVPEILRIAADYDVKLMAPTGRAAKVLSEKNTCSGDYITSRYLPSIVNCSKDG